MGMTWTGIDDKTVLLGRRAAASMLMAYSSFFRPTPPLDSFNAEVYLKKLAQAKGVLLRTLPFSQLPSTDAMYYGNDSIEGICIIRKYWCGGTEYAQWETQFCDVVMPGISKQEN